MSWLKEQWNRCRRLLGKSGPLFTVALGAAVLLSALVLVGGSMMLSGAQNRLEALQRQQAILDRENRILQEQIEGLGSAESIRRIAAEELGLVDPNSIIITDTE